MDEAYKQKVLRNLYESIWSYQNCIDESIKDKDEELAKVIFNAINHPGIVSATLSDLIDESK